MAAEKTFPNSANGAFPSDGAVLAAGRSDKAENLVVVGIGASAGGLEATRHLLDVLPPTSAMAFILVQHLDPQHKSMMAVLLASHTKMTVVDAVDGMPLASNHLYVIPPGRYLSVSAGKLHLTAPSAPHGARLPIDFLLQSMARDCGAKAIAILLSGTGADGSIGIKAIKAARGLVIVQDPSEAAHEGMALSAIETGAVDHVLKVIDMPPAVTGFATTEADPTSKHESSNGGATALGGSSDWLGRVVELIRLKTAHDFTLYKPGTLQRRIERRMGLVALKPSDTDAYLALLLNDQVEVDALATDLLINVTSFFRDKHIFELLVDEIVPDILSRHADEDPVRVWVAGCSSGEEAYSLAIIFHERIALAKPGFKLQIFASDVDPLAFKAPQGQTPSRATLLGDLARQRVLDAFAPATVLVDRKNACVFTLGAVGSHLSIPPGYPTQDLYAMTEPNLHPKLRSAIKRAAEEAGRVTVPARRFQRGDETWSLDIVAEPVTFDTEKLTLLSFIETRQANRKPAGRPTIADGTKVSELEQELAQLRLDLADSVRNLQMSGEEQKAINEEALSVNEEYQATNEELLASKEELQSVNEELTALNAQLQETLDRQRTTSNDLQNVLYSTDVATLFLDVDLRIRFFTPSTKALFNVIPGDVGRPLADLHALAVDDMFVADATGVLASHSASEREIQTYSGTWYVRRILPYRTHMEGVEGVVVTFTDVSDRKRTADALEAAKLQAQRADAAKSRFLAAASHDLRQPLQTLTLLQGLLAQTIEGEKATRLAKRLDETISSMSVMLNTLLDINQIEAGTVSAVITHFPIDELFVRLRDEFTYVAEAKGLILRVVNSSLAVFTDPRLIEQMIRNILSNSLKYTATGKILLGCRRRAGSIRIEVWDTGLGIPQSELQTIFEEYHQIGNAARERANGLGLGLAIVKRLGDVLGAKVSVHSVLGKGSVFAIEIAEAEPRFGYAGIGVLPSGGQRPIALANLTASILVIEDEPDIRTLLQDVLIGDGFKVTAVADGVEAIDMITRKFVRPDLILADFNLPNGMNGLQAVAMARRILHRNLPAVILSGDISADTSADIATQGCAQLSKPVKLPEMRRAIQTRLAIWSETKRLSDKTKAGRPAPSVGPVVFVVDDDALLRHTLRDLLEAEGRTVEDFDSCEAFIAAFRPGREACLLIDATLPGMSGLNLLRHLKAEGHLLPAIMITGNGDVAIAVDAMKAGAMDFIEKPISRTALIASVDRSLSLARGSQQENAWHETALSNLAELTPRQHQIMDMILAGNPNKNIAADLGISQRTVENHRAAIMKRTGASSLPDLARIAVAASRNQPRAPTAET